MVPGCLVRLGSATELYPTPDTTLDEYRTLEDGELVLLCALVPDPAVADGKEDTRRRDVIRDMIALVISSEGAGWCYIAFTGYVRDRVVLRP
jgi:hypothetical protein